MPIDATATPSDPVSLPEAERQEEERHLLHTTLVIGIQVILTFILLCLASFGVAITLLQLLTGLQPALALHELRAALPIGLTLALLLGFAGGILFLLRRGLALPRLLLALATCAWLSFVPRTFDPLLPGIALAGSLLAAIAVLRPKLAPLLAGVAALGLYLGTLAPGPVPGDSPEFQSAAARLGIAHPTGYPLYLLLGHLMMLIPWPGLAAGGRLNLLSTLAAAGAVMLVAFVVYRAAARRETRDKPDLVPGVSAFVAGLILTATPVFWEQALISEVYALNALIVAAIITLLVSGFVIRTARPVQAFTRRERLRRLIFGLDRNDMLLALMVGLGLAHHRTVVLLLPAAGLYLLLANPRRILRLLHPLVLLAGLAPLLLYAYIPLRWPAEFQRSITPEELRSWIFASNYAPFLRLDAWLAAPDRLGLTANFFVQQFNPLELALALIGLVYLLWRSRALAVFMLAGILTYAVFGSGYYVPDVVVMLIPAFLLGAIAAGIGLAALGRLLQALLNRDSPEAEGSEQAENLLPVQSHVSRTFVQIAGMVGLIVLVAVCVAIPVNDIAAGWPKQDLHDQTELLALGRLALGGYDLGNLPVIVADAPRMQAFRYAQGVEGLAPDAYLVQPDTEAAALDVIASSLQAGKQVYLTRILPGIEKQYRLNSTGPLVHITQVAPPLPPMQQTSNALFGDHIRLLGWSRDGTDQANASQAIYLPGTTSITLVWQTDAKLDADYWVRVQLIDRQGKVAWEERGAHPVGDLYPTGAWRPNEPVVDYHTLALPATIAPGEYSIAVSLIVPFAQEGLPVHQDGAPTTDKAMLAQAEIQLDPTWRPQADDTFTPLWAIWDSGFLLEGYHVEEHGGQLKLALAWRAIEASRAGSLEIRAGNRTIRDELAARTPSRFITLLDLPVPANRDTPFTLTLRDGAGATIPVWNGEENLPALTLQHLLPPLPEESGIADFEHMILLQKFEVASSEVERGQPLRLSLTWKALKPIGRDYTVFVHLLDAEGHVRGQVDALPVYGTRPTSTWQPGEVLEDRYEVRLAPDAPPGEYRIEVGLYLPATFQRLYIVTTDDTATGDHILWQNGGSVRFK